MSEHNQLLRDVFFQILEDLAFMFAEEPDDEDLFETGAPYVTVSMPYNGPSTGTVSLSVPEVICPEIAANVLGLDPDNEIITAIPHDALKELLNVICGNLLTKMAGEEPVFDLSVPEVHPLDTEGWNAMRGEPTTESFAVDDYPVLLGLKSN
jgi:CheY-specific phosphatase CheX